MVGGELKKLDLGKSLGTDTNYEKQGGGKADDGGVSSIFRKRDPIWVLETKNNFSQDR